MSYTAQNNKRTAVALSLQKKPDGKTLEQLKRERILAIANGEAVKAGAMGIAVAGCGSVFATYNIPKFAKFMSISAKVSLPVMAGLFFFSLRYEHSISSMNRHPERWGLSDDIVSSGKVTASTMPIHHKILNTLYDNTFSFIAMTGAPFAGYVLSQQLKLTHLTLSQRVMHSRVFAQAGILTIGLSTLAFREWMDKRGRFPEPSDE